MEILSESILEEFENFHTNRHNSTKPPREAYYLFPKDNDIIEVDTSNNKRSVRRIFEGATEYKDFEIQNLKLFSTEIKNYQPKINITWDESISLRYLQATSYDFLKAIKLILLHLEWKKNTLLFIISSKHKEILNSGFIYVHGRDNRYRPIVVLDPLIYSNNSSKYIVDDWINSLFYFFDYAVQNIMIPGQVENWDIICDVGKISIVFLPSDLKTILNALSSNFRCRLFTMYIINVSFIVKIFWKAIKSMIDPITERKIKLLQGNDCKIELFKFINKSQIEEKFGGNAENVKNHFFPPIFPSDEYFKNEDIVEEIIVSEEVYLEKVKNNDKIVRSPYLIYKDNYFTFQGFESNNVKKTEISVYEEAKSHENYDSKYEDCVEKFNTKGNEQINKFFSNEKVDLFLKNCENDDEFNFNVEKNFDIDSTQTNKKRNSKNSNRNKRNHSLNSKIKFKFLESQKNNLRKLDKSSEKLINSCEASLNSNSETAGKNNPQNLDNNHTIIRENVTNFESDSKGVCCGSNLELKCLIF